MPGPQSSLLWRLGLVHVVIGVALLFGALHPIRDALDDQAFELCRGMANIQALNGLALMVLASRPAMERPGVLIFGGVALSAGMAYWIAFTGTHPVDALVPMGGFAMLAGWVWVLLRR